jgi:hypothetical protein
MGIEAQAVVELAGQLKQLYGTQMAKMDEVGRFYCNDVPVPMPELDAFEKPAVANLITQGIDGLAMRISSRLPDCDFPSDKPGDKTADTRSNNARKAILGWWDMNGLGKKFAKRARYYVAYGSAPVLVKPVGPGINQKRKIPYWHVLNPRHMYAVPTSDHGCMEPPAVVVSRTQSFAWLKRNYPLQAQTIYKGRDCRPDTMFELLEYNDEFETVLVVVGQRRSERDVSDYEYGSSACELLERDENRAGVCLAVIPHRLTLERLMGHFDSLLNLFMGQAKMTAYEQIATFRSIFPELWVTSHPNAPSEARIIQPADGRQGIIGEIANGAIQAITPTPSPLVAQSIDRLERAQRVAAGIPSEWGGEAGSNIRTAKRGQEVMSSTSDPTIGEAQEIFAESWLHEDERAIAISKAYWGNRSTSFYIPRSGKPVSDDFRPNDVFKTDFHFVKFSMPGVDAAGIPIELGQRTGTGEMSMMTARLLDPMIEDAQFETDQVELEGIRLALLKGLENQAAQGTLDPHEIALIAKLKRGGKDIALEDAVIEAQEELQRRQAALQDADPGSAETMPGLAQTPPPGSPPAQGAPPPSLAQMLQQLRSPTNQSGAEQAMAPQPQAAAG